MSLKEPLGIVTSHAVIIDQFARCLFDASLVPLPGKCPLAEQALRAVGDLTGLSTQVAEIVGITIASLNEILERGKGEKNGLWGNDKISGALEEILSGQLQDIIGREKAVLGQVWPFLNLFPRESRLDGIWGVCTQENRDCAGVNCNNRCDIRQPQGRGTGVWFISTSMGLSLRKWVAEAPELRPN